MDYTKFLLAITFVVAVLGYVGTLLNARNLKKLTREMFFTKENVKTLADFSVKHTEELITLTKQAKDFDARITSSAKVLTDLQNWRESLDKQIDDNRKKAVARNPTFHVREVR